jgi:L-threonylcarbamoyladenylate synthase
MFEFDNLGDILQTLREGGIILYPSDTLWAIGCDATNPDAVAKVLALKNIEPSKGLVVLAENVDMILKYADHVPPRIDTLLMYHTRPLTVIYEQGENLPKGICAPDGSVAMRVPKDAFCQHLIQLFEKPIVATGACVGYDSLPLTFGSISSEILEGVDYIVRYRREEKSAQEASQIVRLDDNGELDFLRE